MSADQSNQTELHLLQADTLKLISKQQLPAGCTAAAISPNSCCIASVHQPASSDPDNTLVEQQVPQDHQTQAPDPQNHPTVYPQQVSATAGMLPPVTSKTLPGTLSKASADEDAKCLTGARGGKKRKRDLALHTAVVCFQSLPAEVLVACLTASTQAGSSLQAPPDKELADDVAAKLEADTVKAEDSAAPDSDKAQMEAETPSRQAVTAQVNSQKHGPVETV